MATSDKLTENYLTCIICSEVFNNPATLQCDHTFCRSCLLKYTKTQHDAIKVKSIPCPCCRQMTKVTSPERPVEEWVNQVKPTRLIQGLMDDFGPGTVSADTRVCQWCKHEGETTQATSWCSECEESLCDNCLKMHRRVPKMRDHHTAPLSEDVIQKKKRPFMCTDHKDEKVKLFCKDCNKAVCCLCCSINHRQCKAVVTIEDILPHVTTALSKKGDILSKKIKATKSEIAEKKSQMEAIVTRAKDSGTEIKHAVQNVIDKITQKEKNLLSDLTSLKQKQLDEMRSDAKSREITVQMYQQQFEFIDQAVKSECQKDMFAMYESHGDSSNDKVKNQDGRPLVRPIMYVQDMDRLNKAVDDLQLGKVEVVKDVSDHGSSAVLHRIIDCRMEGDWQIPDLYDVEVLTIPDGKIVVVADSENNRIKSYHRLNSKTYEKVLILSDSPWQLARINDTKIAITLHKRNEIVIVRFAPDPAIISTIKTTKHYFGISCLSSSELLGGKCEDINSVDIISFSGQVLRSVTTGIVKYPDYIHVTMKKNLIVTEESAKALVSVTNQGDVNFTYHPSGDRALVEPSGITTTSSGDILLTDTSLNKVIQLTESGQFVRDIITGGLDSPQGLCLDDDGLLYVTSTSCVKVYRFV